MYSLWQDLSHSTAIFYLVTLILKFDLLLKYFNHGFYLVMVAARQALLSSDNSYVIKSLEHTIFYIYIEWKWTGDSHVKIFQNCRFCKYKNHYFQNYPLLIPKNTADEYKITWPWKSRSRPFSINDSWKLFNEPLVFHYKYASPTVYLQFYKTLISPTLVHNSICINCRA